MTKKGLGKGLSALLGDVDGNSSNNNINEINIEDISPGKSQPRVYFDEVSLQELAESVKLYGILQPIMVQQDQKTNNYKIIAGERRYRAAILANLKTIPCIVKDHDYKKTLEIALIENIQRQDLNVIEEAEGYQRLILEHSYTQEELANIIGKSRSHIANLLRIITLSSSIKDKLRNGAISTGHAKILVNHPNAEEIVEIICAKSLNVRQSESLVKNWGKTKIKSSNSEVLSVESQNDLANLVNMLSEKFNMKIAIEKNNNGGKIIFQFETLEQLDEILIKLS